MIKLRKLVAASLAAAFSLGAILQVSAAPKRPAVLDISPDKVESISIMDRDERTGYIITEKEDRAQIVDAINAIDYLPNAPVSSERIGERMLQIRFKDGTMTNYWAYRSVLICDDKQLTDGLGGSDLYKVMNRCMSKYTACAEWLAYASPYTINQLDITRASTKKTIQFTSTSSNKERGEILAIMNKLRAIDVEQVIELKGVDPTTFGKGKLLYTITMDFNYGREGYEIFIFNDGRITISVDSLPYDLSYYSADDETFNELTAILKAYFR